MRYSLLPSARKTPHYGFLLAVLLVLFVVAPVLPAEWTGYGVELFFQLALIASVYSVVWQTRHRLPFLSLAAVTVAARWSDMVLDHGGFSVVSIVLVILLLCYTVGLIVVELFRMQEVDVNTILAAIVAYMLTAVAFASLFELIELLQPGSFAGLPAQASQQDIEHFLLYFSVVSLTTVGYGDVSPVSDIARSTAALEGLFGTLYLAVMIARLVSLHGAPSTADSEDKSSS